MSCPSLVIGDPETFSSAMMVSSVTRRSLCRMISKVTGSMDAVPAVSGGCVRLMTLSSSDADVQPGSIAPSGAGSEIPHLLDQHLGENTQRRFSLCHGSF